MQLESSIFIFFYLAKKKSKTNHAEKSLQKSQLIKLMLIRIMGFSLLFLQYFKYILKNKIKTGLDLFSV